MLWLNGNLIQENMVAKPSQPSGAYIYEVIRINDGIPVFLQEHLLRLDQSIKATQTKSTYDVSVISLGIFKLIAKTGIISGNIRIQVSQENGDTTIGFIPHHYPEKHDYQVGIRTELLHAERSDPNLKLWNPTVRKAADHQISQSGCYEVILVNNRNCLTEGSRSNIFAIRKKILITPPIEQVLPGITRKIIIQLALQNQIDFQETEIQIDDLSGLEAVFISGTSPGILPVNQLDSFFYQSQHPLTSRLSSLYQDMIKQNISETVSKYSKLILQDE